MYIKFESGGGNGLQLYDKQKKMGDLLRLQQRRTTDLEERVIRVTHNKPLRGAVRACVWSSALTRKSPH